MNIEELYDSVLNNIWRTWEIVEKTDIYESPEEPQTRDYPGSPYSAEIRSKFTITIHRNSIGNFTDKEWEELSKYVCNRANEMNNDKDFEDVFGDSLQAFIKYYNNNMKYIDDIVDNFIEDEVTAINFKYDSNKWVVHIEYQ